MKAGRKVPTTSLRQWVEYGSDLFLVRSQPSAWMAAAFWVAVAAVSTCFAVFVALQPGRLQDLYEVRVWLHYWMTSGRDPYDTFRNLDYPPVAFLVLWPLGLVSDATVPYWFLPLGIGTMVAAGWVLLRWMGERMYIDLSTSERVALVAIMVAGGGARTSLWLGQSISLSLLFGALALLWSRSRPYVAALALTLCAFKPHVAVGFGLAILLTTGADVIILAAALTLSLSLLFALTVGDSLLNIVVEYAGQLLHLYSGPNRIRGLLSIRFVLNDLIDSYAASTALYVLLAAGCLTLLVIFSKRKQRDAATQSHVAVACILWSILFLPHQLYNSLLAAPALWLLMWPEAGIFRSRTMRAVVVASYVLFGVVDLPRALRVVSQILPNFEWAFWTSYYLSPLRMALVFGLILWSLYRRPHGRDVPDGAVK